MAGRVFIMGTLLVGAATLQSACHGDLDGPASGGGADGSSPAPDGAAGSADGVPAPDGAGSNGDAFVDPCVFLCDDFEAYTLGGPPGGAWVVSTNGGAVAIDDARAASGTHAVHVTTDGGSGTYRRAFFSIEGAPLFPALASGFYGRMRIWVTAAAPDGVHWTNIQGEGNVTGMGFRAFVRYGGMNLKRLLANYDTSGVSSDCWQESATTVPEQRWACVEWQLDATTDTMRFWLDGAPLDDLTVAGSGAGCIADGTGGHWYAPAYDALRLGWERYQTSTALEMWIDDVAISDRRIGCP